MVNLKDIEKFYQPHEQVFKKNILREYLQYKILQILFNSEYALKLSFMGGTCLRIVYNTSRFSEDLDFDNFNLKTDDFDAASNLVKKGLELEGYTIEIKNIYKGAYHCYIRIPGLLFNNLLSGFKEEKVLIQFDTESQKFPYEPDRLLINKFDVFTNIFVTPKDILLSQKIWAIINRKVPKGRDFYDSVFLFSITVPNYKYLENKMGIKNLIQLKEKLLTKCKEFNFTQLVKDVEPFIINKNELNRILLFMEFIKKL